MSMRATFTTEYIYDGDKGYFERKVKMCEILNIEAKEENMVGQLSGILSGLDLSEEDVRRWLEEQVYELGKITIVPFGIVYLLEGGDLIYKKVYSYSKEKK